MLDIDQLRQAMHAETADLPMQVPVDRVYRRARGIRTLRVATVAYAVLMVAIAVPVGLVGRARPAGGLPVAGRPTPSPSACPPPALGAEGAPSLLGSIVETGTSIQAPNQRRYDVVLALLGPRNDPAFAVGFRDQQSGDVQPWDMTGMQRGPRGDFTAKGETWQFASSQLPLGADRVLDMGIYSRTGYRITVASEGHTSQAHITENVVTGWTFFWVVRAAKPLPVDANAGPHEYEGPERLTITAYDATGHPMNTVTGGYHIGVRTHNPRDNGPDTNATPTPGCRRV